jgi:RNA polymerase sigma factor (sigma-70 family)
MLGDYDSALDVTQEVFIKVYNSLHRYSSEYKFSTWLYRIAHNATIDQDHAHALASIAQTGNGHRASIYQKAGLADGTHAGITQSGEGHTASIHQDSLHAFLTANVNQSGSLHVAQISQSGAWNEAAVIQSGNGHSASVTQSGVGASDHRNSATVNQSGFGNAASVVQMGAGGNVANVTQN